MVAKKIEKGKIYYYGNDIEKMKCIKVGVEQSVFIDCKNSFFRFYNTDMHINRRKPQ